MTERRAGTVRLKVSPAVAQIARAGSDTELQLKAARGEADLSPVDMLCCFLVLYQQGEAPVKSAVLRTVRSYRAEQLLALAGEEGVSSRVLDFLAKVRLADPVFLQGLWTHPVVEESTRLYLLEKASADVLGALSSSSAGFLAAAGRLEALTANASLTAQQLEHILSSGTGDGGTAETPAEEEEPDTEGMSKYQLALEMGVSAKIKMALTGDKEWRGLFIQSPNKLVSSAVLKNPRISDGEVLALAKNKAATDDQIRLITMNRDWVKNYQVKLALVMHPRTPLPKALRYMGVLTEKDLKNLSKSKGVSQVIVNNARRMLLAKLNKR